MKSGLGSLAAQLVDGIAVVEVDKGGAPLGAWIVLRVGSQSGWARAWFAPSNKDPKWLLESEAAR